MRIDEEITPENVNAILKRIRDQRHEWNVPALDPVDTPPEKVANGENLFVSFGSIDGELLIEEWRMLGGLMLYDHSTILSPRAEFTLYNILRERVKARRRG